MVGRGSKKFAKKGNNNNSNLNPSLKATMMVYHDQFALNWWLGRSLINLQDDHQWNLLRDELHEKFGLTLKTAYIKRRWINSIDAWLDKEYEGVIRSRFEYGYSMRLSESESLNLCSHRLLDIREIERAKQRSVIGGGLGGGQRQQGCGVRTPLGRMTGASATATATATVTTTTTTCSRNVEVIQQEEETLEQHLENVLWSSSPFPSNSSFNAFLHHSQQQFIMTTTETSTTTTETTGISASTPMTGSPNVQGDPFLQYLTSSDIPFSPVLAGSSGHDERKRLSSTSSMLANYSPNSTTTTNITPLCILSGESANESPALSSSSLLLGADVQHVTTSSSTPLSSRAALLRTPRPGAADEACSLSSSSISIAGGNASQSSIMTTGRRRLLDESIVNSSSSSSRKNISSSSSSSRNNTSRKDVAQYNNKQKYEQDRKRHKLDVEWVMPREFENCRAGAASVDIEGLRLPAQYFRGYSFFLLQLTQSIMGVTLKNVQSYLLQVHGGRVLKLRSEIERGTTIFVASDDRDRNEKVAKKYSNAPIYSANFIAAHITEDRMLTMFTIQPYILKFSRSTTTTSIITNSGLKMRAGGAPVHSTTTTVGVVGGTRRTRSMTTTARATIPTRTTRARKSNVTDNNNDVVVVLSSDDDDEDIYSNTNTTTKNASLSTRKGVAGSSFSSTMTAAASTRTTTTTASVGARALAADDDDPNDEDMALLRDVDALETMLNDGEEEARATRDDRTTTTTTTRAVVVVDGNDEDEAMLLLLSLDEAMSKGEAENEAAAAAAAAASSVSEVVE